MPLGPEFIFCVTNSSILRAFDHRVTCVDMPKGSMCLNQIIFNFTRDDMRNLERTGPTLLNTTILNATIK